MGALYCGLGYGAEYWPEGAAPEPEPEPEPISRIPPIGRSTPLSRRMHLLRDDEDLLAVL